MEIATSLLSVERVNFSEIAYRIEAAGTNYFHIDVMDGKFVENSTINLMKEYADQICGINNTPMEVHLMVDNVKEYVDMFLPNNPREIVFHIEALKKKAEKENTIFKDEVMEMINYIKSEGSKVGIAISPDTDIKEVYKFLPYIHTVLVMTVNPGYGGQTFIENCVAKIDELKKYIDDNNLENEIEVDGGINFDTIIKCKEAGAERAVVGSFLVNAKDLNYTMNKLKNA